MKFAVFLPKKAQKADKNAEILLDVQDFYDTISYGNKERDALLLLFRRTMESLEPLKELISPVLEACGVRLYELKWISNEQTLQIAIVKSDGSMDLDTCAEVSEQLSETLDRSQLLTSAYTLEVCSPGAEREIHDLSELKQMEKPYIFVRLKHPIRKQTEFKGEITAYDGSTITLSYRDKAAVREAVFEESEIEYIRLAVRI